LRAAPRANGTPLLARPLGYQACNLRIVGGPVNGREALTLPDSTA